MLSRRTGSGMFCAMLDPFDPDSFIIVADAHIVGIEPRIERTQELPVKLNFPQFHEVIQAAFGWTDSHLSSPPERRLSWPFGERAKRLLDEPIKSLPCWERDNERER